MQFVDVAHNEEARQNAIRDLGILNTPPSESYDRLTRMASKLIGAPVSTISLTDGDRQWFKSKVGVDLVEIPRHQAPCSYAIKGCDVFVVPDLLEDDRFKDSPLAQAGIRFYAGAPLHTRAGHGLGTICVVDVAPRNVDDAEKAILSDLAALVMSQIDVQNMIGRVDPTTGFPNQHQMFVDVEDAATRHPGDPASGVVVEIMSPSAMESMTAVLGVSHVETVVKGAMEAVRRTAGNRSRVYHVGAQRCLALIEGGDAQDASDLARRAIDALSVPISCGGVPVTLGPVTGTYAFAAGDDKPRDVLRRMLNACDDARKTEDGRAAYDVASDQGKARAFALINDFGAALATEGQLKLVYQPRIEMATGRMRGVEALLRWTHPTLGFVSPGEFVPLVEQTALAKPMTDWVISEAIRQARAWEVAGMDVCVSVNASAKNLDERDFADRLLTAVRGAGLSPHHLELEFTESAVSNDQGRVIEQMTRIKAAGIAIAIDDFGSGYSNLAYMQRLPVSVIKIDMSFVRTLDQCSRNQTLVKAVTAMAHDLGYGVVAEGVETQAIYDLLLGYGVDEGQGYLMSRPVSPAEVEAYQGFASVATKTPAAVEPAPMKAMPRGWSLRRVLRRAA